MKIFIACIGYLAGFCGILSFIPQAIKTIKTKNTKSISLKTYIIYLLANACFLLFGILSIVLPIMQPENSTNLTIIIWGLTLILPYSITIISVAIIIFIKVQNIIKQGEHHSYSHKTEDNDLQVINNAI